MRLICYPTSGDPPRLVAAPVERGWMEQTPNGFAYRCLPLNIANAHGWLVLNTASFVARWSGGNEVDAITIKPRAHGAPLLASSHFGSGILTFSVAGLFRTEPGYDLLVTGPFNNPKDAVQPLTGIVETDWSPFTFTMNWKFTRALVPVAFGRDEPFCMIFPILRSLIETVEPEIRSLDEDPEVREAYRAWAESRQTFNQGLKVPGSEARTEKWQKDYFRGSGRFGAPPDNHRTKLQLRDFKNKP